jgi:hypothetical protein
MNIQTLDTVILHFLNRMNQPHFLEIKRRYEEGASLGDYAQAIIEFACATGNVPLLEQYLSDAVDPTLNCMDYAIAHGHLNVVKRLLLDPRVSPVSRIAAVNKLPEMLYHHIMIAAHKGDPDIFEALMRDPRTDPNAESDHAICVAIGAGNFKLIEILLRDSRTRLNERIIDCAKQNPVVLQIFQKEADLRLAYLNAVAIDSVAQMIEIEQTNCDFNPSFENGIALFSAIGLNHGAGVRYMLQSLKFSRVTHDFMALLTEAVSLAASDAFYVLAEHFLCLNLIDRDALNALETQMKSKRF